MYFIDYAKNGLDWKEKIKIEVLEGYMKRRVEGLRFDIGAALYGFGFGSRFNDELLFYSLNISLDCIPEELGWLRKECDKIIEGTKSNPLSTDIFKEVKNRIVHPIYDADRLERNDQMAKRLYKAYRYELPWIEASRIENYARSLTLKDIQKTAIKYFKAENRIEFVMGTDKPEP
jgi:predicted Zn-dependent peptidase